MACSLWLASRRWLEPEEEIFAAACPGVNLARLFLIAFCRDAHLVFRAPRDAHSEFAAPVGASFPAGFALGGAADADLGTGQRKALLGEHGAEQHEVIFVNAFFALRGTRRRRLRRLQAGCRRAIRAEGECEPGQAQQRSRTANPHPHSWMAQAGDGMPDEATEELLNLLFLFSQHFLLFLILLFFLFFLGDDVEVDRVGLHHLEFDLALRAAQDFAFFHFVFVHVNLGGAFGTPNHGETSLRGARTRSERAYYITPRAPKVREGGGRITTFCSLSPGSRKPKRRAGEEATNDRETRVSGPAGGRSGRRGDRRRARLAHPPRQRAAEGRVVHPRRHAGSGGNTGRRSCARAAGRNRAGSESAGADRGLRSHFRGESERGERSRKRCAAEIPLRDPRLSLRGGERHGAAGRRRHPRGLGARRRTGRVQPHHRGHASAAKSVRHGARPRGKIALAGCAMALLARSAAATTRDAAPPWSACRGVRNAAEAPLARMKLAHGGFQVRSI